MGQQLVVTSIGTNRRGMVNQITQLAAGNELNILYSRMAIMGQEFTYVMLVEGSAMRISRFESAFIQLSTQLELMSVVKRTSNHRKQEIEKHAGYVKCHTEDKTGSLAIITDFFSEQGLSLANLRCEGSTEESGESKGQAELSFFKPEDFDAQSFSSALDELMQAHNINYELAL
ncbi:hypothetical protein HR060_03770 [Catenovulum sp. SM1970]|uniref:glycine cleavage system protein R n=1 Tax=Marinifaba aquimaris TaxID=2741323 RepID=UPI001574808D|nr:ACT domain-containing protein [Marinifaba aquimaris]NTS75976.1 hypothetical protein [Marinifaba aquimaris]